jgi:hypothetical protein
MNDYLIHYDTIFFSPDFNKPLSNYLDILNKYNKLIFSNYDDPSICIQTNNRELHINYKENKFNQPLNLPHNITHLTFGDNFNQSIILPSELTHLTFGYIFNQSIIIPSELTHLTFGWAFNQSVILPLNLTHLTFGENFNQSVILPLNLINLTFGYFFNQLVNWTPQNLTHLTFGHKFNQSVVLPPNLTYLTFGHFFNQILDLPTSIKYLKLSSDYHQNIVDNLPNGLEELELHNIENLELSNLPSGIKKIVFYKYCKYNKELNCLPKSIEYIILNIDYDKKISNIPANFKTLECSKDYKFINDFIDKYEVIQY